MQLYSEHQQVLETSSRSIFISNQDGRAIAYSALSMLSHAKSFSAKLRRDPHNTYVYSSIRQYKQHKRRKAEDTPKNNK